MCDSLLQAFANLSVATGPVADKSDEVLIPDFKETSEHMRQPWWHSFSVEDADRQEFEGLRAAPEFYWGNYMFTFEGDYESMRLEARVGVDRVLRVLYLTGIRFEFFHYIWGNIDCTCPSTGPTERLRDLMDDLGITERHIFGALYKKLFSMWPLNDGESIKLID